MFKTLLNYFLYDKCIDIFFMQVYKNFLSPKDLNKILDEYWGDFMNAIGNINLRDWDWDLNHFQMTL